MFALRDILGMANVRKRNPLPKLAIVPFRFTLDLSGFLWSNYEGLPAWVLCPPLRPSLSLLGLGYFDWSTWAGEVGPYD